MYICNSLITSKDNKVEPKKKKKNCFQVNTGQIRDCIDNMKLTFLN